MEIIDNTPDSIYQVGNVINTDEGPALICSETTNYALKTKRYFSVSLENGALLSDYFDSLEELTRVYGRLTDERVKATLTIERY